jgi:hypothetical protein
MGRATARRHNLPLKQVHFPQVYCFSYFEMVASGLSHRAGLTCRYIWLRSFPELRKTPQKFPQLRKTPQLEVSNYRCSSSWSYYDRATLSCVGCNSKLQVEEFYSIEGNSSKISSNEENSLKISSNEENSSTISSDSTVFSVR